MIKNNQSESNNLLAPHSQSKYVRVGKEPVFWAKVQLLNGAEHWYKLAPELQVTVAQYRQRHPYIWQSLWRQALIVVPIDDAEHYDKDRQKKDSHNPENQPSNSPRLQVGKIQGVYLAEQYTSQHPLVTGDQFATPHYNLFGMTNRQEVLKLLQRDQPDSAQTLIEQSLNQWTKAEQSLAYREAGKFLTVIIVSLLLMAAFWLMLFPDLMMEELVSLMVGIPVAIGCSLIVANVRLKSREHDNQHGWQIMVGLGVLILIAILGMMLLFSINPEWLWPTNVIPILLMTELVVAVTAEKLKIMVK